MRVLEAAQLLRAPIHQEKGKLLPSCERRELKTEVQDNDPTTAKEETEEDHQG
jgi:hypothetical protein